MSLTLILLSIPAVALLFLLLPIRGTGSIRYVPPSGRFHEADAVLSRRLLHPGTRAYESYYRSRPEARAWDDRSRDAPGLLSSGGRHYHPGTFSAATANFSLIDHLGTLTHAHTLRRPAGEHATHTPPNPHGDMNGEFPPPAGTREIERPPRAGTGGGERTSPAGTGNGERTSTAGAGEGEKTSTAGAESGAEKKAVGSSQAGTFIKSWLIRTGAHSVGFTPLKDYHLYSHKGRGAERGKPVQNTHPHAIAISVEMDHRMMQSSPLGTSVMESSEQYLRSGILALKLAAFIRELGYEATAHIDGNYDVICPLVAADAGLGVIGRMGLLMTPRLGPRVRISVVTTDLPLEPDEPEPGGPTLDFCRRCRKCARVCPAGAIPTGPRKKIDGVPRWRIHSEKCYHFWTLSGTDCGRCISACPFSHRDVLFHRLIRLGVKNNLFFRQLAIKLDDVFYGSKPPVRPLPGWSEIAEGS